MQMVNREKYLRNAHQRHELSQAVTEMKTEKCQISVWITVYRYILSNFWSPSCFYVSLKQAKLYCQQSVSIIRGLCWSIHFTNSNHFYVPVFTVYINASCDTV